MISFVVGPVLEARGSRERRWRFLSYAQPVGGPSPGEWVRWLYIAINVNCPAQLTRALEYFASRAGMEYNGLGRGSLKNWWLKSLVSDPADLYSLVPSFFLDVGIFRR